MVILDKISFKYAHKTILSDLSFFLKKGEIGSLIGLSGSGKTTIFKLLTGLLPLQQGTLKIGEEKLLCHSQIACMMQEDLLLPWRTILSNLTLLKEIGKKPSISAKTIEKAKDLLDEMGLSHCAKMFPNELSSGMRQRVSFARALLQELPILLLDEPFASLDVAIREHLYLYLRQIQKKQQMTILMVTHDFRDALSLSDRIFFLSDGKIAKTWEVTDSVRSDPSKCGKLLDQMRQAIINS